MARFILLIGIMLLAGAAFVVNDATKRSVQNPDYTFDTAAYASELPGRIKTYMSDDVGPRIAALPQVAREMVHDYQNPPEEQVEATDRLATIKHRNRSFARNGISMDDLANMSPWEIYENRELIMKSMTQSAKNQMGNVMK
ncbi:hypothetical protein Z945_998 [Sulfitobacter noctilucae]|uniref:hypothetical protein n=1 Tax=Sulfitobacter noctilucae TaxID=1342302 RepID=UPI00046AD75F|nr:hypothetical protein [Sulfitobacter noctilucae]KIN60031.1 hypothetical protein Z945_998 [Sulfitobacter noctilucae]